MSESPVLVGLPATLQFAENELNGFPQLIDPQGLALLSDPDLDPTDASIFTGGSLLVSVTGPGDDDQVSPIDGAGQDVLGLRDFTVPGGVGDSQLVILGEDVILRSAFSDTLIGTIDQDGRDGRPFELQLTANASIEIVELLIRNLTYQNISDAPTPVRQITVRVSDRDGNVSEPAQVAVEIVPSVDAIPATGTERRANTESSGIQD